MLGQLIELKTSGDRQHGQCGFREAVLPRQSHVAMALTGVVVTRTQNSFNLLDVPGQRAIEINVAAPVADYPGRKAPVVQRPRLKCQVTSLLKLQRMDHVGIKPANNAREPGGSRQPAFRKSRGEHLRPVCAQRQWPESPLAKGLACAIRAATGVT